MILNAAQFPWSLGASGGVCFWPAFEQRGKPLAEASVFAFEWPVTVHVPKKGRTPQKVQFLYTDNCEPSSALVPALAGAELKKAGFLWVFKTSEGVQSTRIATARSDCHRPASRSPITPWLKSRKYGISVPTLCENSSSARQESSCWGTSSHEASAGTPLCGSLGPWSNAFTDACVIPT